MKFLDVFNKNSSTCNKNDEKVHNKKTDKQIVGKIGEDYACDYLKSLGYKVVNRNYLKKWGEIDIVAEKNKKIHFVEVKSVSRDTLYDGNRFVTRETKDDYRPEDNIHPWKLQRLGRVIQSYILDKDISDDMDWQFDVITVYIDKNKSLLKINLLEDIVL